MSGKKTPKLGQHFLTDETIIDEIISFADVSNNDTVLEIGPGKGILTEGLLKSGAKVIAVEKDHELFGFLRKKYRNNDNFAVYQGDIRDFDYKILPKGYKIVANIPYYLTGQLISQLTESSNKPKEAVLMIQKEVAERLTAPKGESSLLQLSTEVFAKVERGRVVTRDKFNPPPKVDSALIKLIFASKSALNKEEQKVFFRFLKFAFAGKRKKLLNTLPGALKIDKNELLKVLSELNLSENSRPQELDLKQWITLYKFLLSRGIL